MKDVNAMKMFDIIARKRDGKALTYEELKFFVDGIVSNKIPDYQTTALMMAIYLNGMSRKETAELCMLMAVSGDTLEFSDEYEDYVEDNAYAKNYELWSKKK